MRNEERTLKLICGNREITVKAVARKLNMSVGSAYTLIHTLKFSKKKKLVRRWKKCIAKKGDHVEKM